MSYQRPSGTKQQTVTSGTGTITISGADAALKTWQQGVGTGGFPVDYKIDSPGVLFEEGTGVYTSSGQTLTRPSGNVKASSNGGALVSLPGTAVNVYVTLAGHPYFTDTGAADRTLSVKDNANVQQLTGAAARTCTLPALNTVPQSFQCPFENASTAAWTLDGNGTEPIACGSASATTLVIPAGHSGDLWVDVGDGSGGHTSWRFAFRPNLNAPFNLGNALNEAQGADVASGSTVNLDTATGNVIDVTGTTTITAITLSQGRERTVRFTGALTLTNGASLVLLGGVDILTVAGDFAIFRGYAAGVVRMVSYARASGYPIRAPENLTVWDQKTAGTDGGGFTAGSWQTRGLNTTGVNTIAGASLASNQIVLPAGTYEIFARAQARKVDEHVVKLANITDTADTLIGAPQTSASTDVTSNDSIVSGVFTIAAPKTFELQHRCVTTKATDGFGHAANVGVVEIYAHVRIRKLA